MKQTKIILVGVLMITAATFAWVTISANNSQPEDSNKQSDAKVRVDTKTDDKPDSSFDRSRLSISDPDSVWVVVNKQRPLSPETYTPDDLVFPDVRLRVPGNESMQLRAEPAAALERMFSAAEKEGISLMLSSGYRSYAYQQNLYGSYVASEGQASADTFSARPAHSEHQTGLVADIRPTNGTCELEECFGDMAEGKWLAANAAEYGFILRYSRTNRNEAGYTYEPWHFRYVGKELAQEYMRTNATSLESFFGLPPAPNYN